MKTLNWFRFTAMASMGLCVLLISGGCASSGPKKKAVQAAVATGVAGAAVGSIAKNQAKDKVTGDRDRLKTGDVEGPASRKTLGDR